MSNSIDAVSGSLNRHLDEERRWEMWFEANEGDLMEEFAENHPMDERDSRAWERFLEARYETYLNENWR